jgi:hypothetical protein
VHTGRDRVGHLILTSVRKRDVFGVTRFDQQSRAEHRLRTLRTWITATGCAEAEPMSATCPCRIDETEGLACGEGDAARLERVLGQGDGPSSRHPHVSKYAMPWRGL